MPKKFSAEFRSNVIRVAKAADVPLRETAKDFGISEQTLHRWLREEEIADAADPDAARAEAAQLRAAKKRIRTLEQEVEVLRSAAAYFARDVHPK